MNQSGMGKICFPLWRNVVQSIGEAWQGRCISDEVGEYLPLAHDYWRVAEVAACL